MWLFIVKSWFFTRNTPTIFTPPFARCKFFKCARPPLTWNPGSARDNHSLYWLGRGTIDTSSTHIHDHSHYWLGRGTIDTSNTHIHDHSHYWLGRGTIDTSNTHIHDHSHYWPGRCTIDTSNTHIHDCSLPWIKHKVVFECVRTIVCIVSRQLCKPHHYYMLCITWMFGNDNLIHSI